MSTKTHGQTLGSIVFTTSAWATEILDIKDNGIKRDAIDVTNMGVSAVPSGSLGNKIYIPSFYMDPGILTIEVNHNPDHPAPVGGVAETITLSLGPDSSQATVAGSGFITDYDINLPMDGKAMTATVKIKKTGPWAYTTGS